MEEEAAVAVDTLSRNNQPTTDSEVELPEAEPRAPLCPTSDVRTGITATPTAEMWTTPTPAQRAPGQVQGTTRMQPTATRWVLKRWSSQDHPPIGSRPHRAQPAPPSAQQQQQRLPVLYFLMQAMQAPAWQQAAPPVGHGGMPPTGYNGGQRLIMPNHHGPNMINFVGQYPPAASVMQPGQQPMEGIFYPPPQQPGYF